MCKFMLIIRLKPITKKVHIYQSFSIEISKPVKNQVPHIMSDNISPDEIKRRLILFLRIPTEVWTDVFKLLPRRVLVQKVAPVCYKFKEISNKNVKNVHVIESANQFTKKLKNDDPEAMKHLENLAADECQLAGQFKLSEIWIGEKSQAILRHCPDLFNSCKIELYFVEENKSSLLFLQCLAQLEEAKPVVIDVEQRVDQVVDFWHHPTFQNCSRIELDFWSSLSDATLTTAFANIYGWLHHQPIDKDCVDDAAQQVRCMIITSTSEPVHIDWLLDRCSKNIQQAQDLTDRRSYVLSFDCSDSDWPGFGRFRRIENKFTGEVLLLDRRVLDGNGEPIADEYRLRRCLAEEEASGPEFYSGVFKQDYGFEEFKIDDKTPEVTIE